MKLQEQKKKNFLKDRLKQRPYEGKHGKDELKKCMMAREDYSETKHGPKLFAILRFDEARKRSKSLDSFLDLAKP